MSGEIDFNRILEIFQQFGPERVVPIEDRWRELFPTATDGQMVEWKAHCERIEAGALELAEQVLDRQLGEVAARDQLGELFPELNEERLGHTFSQAIYFASQ